MKKILKIIGALTVILVVVVALASHNSPSTATPAAQAASAKSDQAPAAAPAADKPAVAPAAHAADKPVDANRGISFGTPKVLNHSGVNTVLVPVTNTTDQVKSFTVKATFKNGSSVAATASGAVNDLLPQQKRVVALISTDAIPATYDSVRVDVDTMVREAKTTKGADAAHNISFGEPAIKGGAMPSVEVEVTNGDSATHSFTVQGAFYDGDDVVGLATGAVNDLAPGQTKTATLLVQGSTKSSDQPALAIDTLVK
jgi:hypothetical protein